MLEAPRATVREEIVGGGGDDDDGVRGRQGWSYVASALACGEGKMVSREKQGMKHDIHLILRETDRERRGWDSCETHRNKTPTKYRRETIRVPLSTAPLSLIDVAVVAAIATASPSAARRCLSLFFFSLPLSIRPCSWATVVASLCDHASGISREILADDVAMDTAGSDRERRLPRRARIPCPFLLSPPRCAPHDRKCQYPLSRAAPAMRPLTPSYTHPCRTGAPPYIRTFHVPFPFSILSFSANPFRHSRDPFSSYSVSL